MDMRVSSSLKFFSDLGVTFLDFEWERSPNEDASKSMDTPEEKDDASQSLWKDSLLGFPSPSNDDEDECL